ncbi:MAG TPA: hypothetical protein VGX25_22395 [Actinophytocola sp.]|uniref:hypothetical protein n=1 Tax=Actinophytocola sp. TaxID=1872138 RepID=UPI002DDD28A3|nr:hypothetical protein [Actinophytocola sp.]HEV2782152.1 hypothetical protein [Actinophytocola sp.]
MRKMKGAFGVVGSVTGAVSAVTSLKRARADRDKLLLANAIASIAVAVTGALLAVRSLKKGGDDA